MRQTFEHRRVAGGGYELQKGDEFDICEGGDGVKEGHAGMAEVFVTIGLRKVYSCTWGSSKRCFVISILCHRPSNEEWILPRPKEVAFNFPFISMS